MRIATLWCLCLCLAPCLRANDAPSFRRDVAPILQAKCVGCHGPKKASARYRLDSFEKLLVPGRKDEAPIVPGDADESYLFALLVEERARRRMPKDSDPLPAKDIETIRQWIAAGAPFDGPDRRAGLATLVPVAAHPRPPEPYPVALAVTALAFHPDGAELAVSGYHEITVWSPRDGKLLRRLPNVEKRTLALDWHRDGELLAVAGGSPGRRGEASLLEAASGRLVARLAAEAEVFLDLAFDPSGELLALAAANGSVLFFDAATGAERGRILAHTDWVQDLDWSPDGKLLGSASRDGTARAFEILRPAPAEGTALELSTKLLATYSGHGGPVTALAFAGEGPDLWTAGADLKVHRWHAKDGKHRGDLAGFEGEVARLVTAGGRVYSACEDHLVREHEAKSRKELRRYAGHPDWVYAIATTPDGNTLASGGLDGAVRVWSTGSGALLLTFLARPPPRPQREF